MKLPESIDFFENNHAGGEFRQKRGSKFLPPRKPSIMMNDKKLKGLNLSSEDEEDNEDDDDDDGNGLKSKKKLKSNIKKSHAFKKEFSHE
jgi:hypothetical protein